MKQKMIISGCVVFIVAAVTAMLIFILSGSSEEEIVSDALIGTWEVVANLEEESVTLLENEFIVFDTEMASCYKEGGSVPYVSSRYRIEEGEQPALQLSDIDRSYVIEIKNENYICLYESPDKHMRLIRCANEDRSSIKLDQKLIIGKWNVTYRNADDFSGEIIEFSDSDLADYRKGATEPYAESDYVWSSSTCFTAEQLGKMMEVHPQTEDIICLVETDTGDVWELQRIK